MRGKKRAAWVNLALVLGLSSFSPPLSALADVYPGVVPGAQVRSASAPKTKGRPKLTRPGFQVLADGASRIFVQVDRSVRPELRREGAHWVVRFPRARLARGNARLPLDTHHFNTPLNSARWSLKEDAVLWHLALRVPVEPRLRTEQTAAGFVCYVEFPAGKYP